MGNTLSTKEPFIEQFGWQAVGKITSKVVLGEIGTIQISRVIFKCLGFGGNKGKPRASGQLQKHWIF